MAEKRVKVRMLQSGAGEYEGKTYSLQTKAEYDLPEPFAQDLIRANYAVPVKAAKVEKATSKKGTEKNVL